MRPHAHAPAAPAVSSGVEAANACCNLHDLCVAQLAVDRLEVQRYGVVYHRADAADLERGHQRVALRRADNVLVVDVLGLRRDVGRDDRRIAEQLIVVVARGYPSPGRVPPVERGDSARDAALLQCLPDGKPYS